MRISSKGDYGLRALFDLAQRIGEGPIQSDAIAARQGLPVNYLNQVLLALRQAGLIESVRGPQGGHMLARPPEAISLLAILIALEGAVGLEPLAGRLSAMRAATSSRCPSLLFCPAEAQPDRSGHRKAPLLY